MSKMGNINYKGFLENNNKKKSSETKGNNQGRAPRIVVYCPICPEDPWKKPSIVVPKKASRASCKVGHVFDIGGKAHHDEPTKDSGK